MILGQYSVSAESNGRVMLPKAVRQYFKAKSLVLTRGYDNCLLLIDSDQFKSVIKEITSESFLNPDKRDTERFLLGSAFAVKLDNHGRLIIPEPLRQYSQIKNKITFVGLVNRVEVWSETVWLKHQEYLTKHSQEIAKRLLEVKSSLK